MKLTDGRNPTKNETHRSIHPQEALGVAVSAYYAQKYRSSFITAAGREKFRLQLIQSFSEVTGVASVAGRLARTDPELDAQIQGESCFSPAAARFQRALDRVGPFQLTDEYTFSIRAAPQASSATCATSPRTARNSPSPCEKPSPRSSATVTARSSRSQVRSVHLSP